MQNKSNSVKENYYFIYEDNKLLVKNIDGQVKIPVTEDVIKLDIDIEGARYFGTFKDCGCYSIDKPTDYAPQGEMVFQEIRQLGDILNEELLHLSFKGLHLLRWFENNKYCPKCGTLGEDKQDEIAKICPVCDFINYPRISPAIIVAIVNKDRLLLAHNSRFPNGRYSVIAGFVEPGETFEECVAREVKEEVGIEVKNIKYFGSQPWPFPDSVMVGFTAEYAGGEIEPDGIEIMDAKWYRVDELPTVPSSVSVAGKLINWFVESYSYNLESREEV